MELWWEGSLLGFKKKSDFFLLWKRTWRGILFCWLSGAGAAVVSLQKEFVVQVAL